MFKQIVLEEDLRSTIKRVFDLDLDIAGGFGYTKESATVLKKSDPQLHKIIFNLAHMRAYIEMNLMQEKSTRYGSINLIEKERKEEGDFLQITYEVSAMLESDYAKFIDEYKQNYEEEGFDLEDHFNRRKEATLKRNIEYWYQLV
jgi:hypothetical protein